jgi:NAD-dependent DNA ligase
MKKINWKKINENPQNIINKLSIKEIDNILNEAEKLYYEGNPKISDEIYDFLLESIQKKGYIKNRIGAELSQKVNKEKLPQYMGSMDKVKPDESSLRIWFEKYKNNYIISDKLDGISGLLCYFDSNNIKLFTRGDGNYGQNISAIIPYLKLGNLKNNIYPVYFRGELIISKKNWKYFSDKYSNPRSAVIGIVTKEKGVEIELLKKIDFVVFDVYINNKKLTPLEQLEFSKKNNFNTTYFKYFKNLNKNILSNILIDRRKKSPYEIDGIIVSENKYYEPIKEGNPKHQVAFKMIIDDQKMETTVINIEWNVSKDFILKPIVLINPVNIGGSIIKRVSGYNARFIVENGIGIGSKVIVIKSGDVIPKIIEVVKRVDKVILPNDNWEWNDTGVDIILTNKVNDEAEIQKIIYFFNEIGVPEFKEGLIRKVYMNGFNTINKILQISVNDLLKIEGIQSKTANKIYNNINYYYQNSDIEKIIAGLNCLGSGFGTKKIKIISSKIPDFGKKEIKNLENKLKDLPGFSDKTIKKVMDNYKNCLKKLNEMPKRNTIKKEVKINENLNNKRIVFTGLRNQELEDLIINSGGFVQSKVNYMTDYIIAKDINEESSKLKEAKKLGKKIISLEEFKKIMKIK